MASRQPNSSSAHGISQRRYHRQAVVQEAVLKTSGLAGIHCEIRDFCQGGVFLQLPDGERAIKALQVRQVEHVEIHFTPRANEATLHLRGRIAHISANGIGVAFLEPPPPAVLRVLQERAQVAATTAQPTDGNALDPNRIQEICRQALDELLPGILGDFFKQIEPSLLEASEKAGTNAEQAAFFETIAQLKTHRPRIENGFCTRVLEQAGSLSATDVSPFPEAFGTAGLTLVDKSEFEDWLNLNAEIARTENLHEAELQVVEQRLSSLARREINKKNNPYGPGMLTHAFRSVLNELHLQNPVKRILYGAFTDALEPKLSGLYQRLDAVTRPVADISLQSAATKRVASAAEQPALAEPALESLQASEAQPQPELPSQAVQPEKSGVLETAGVLWELCGRIQAANRQTLSSASAAAPSSIIAALRQLQTQKTTRNVDYIDSQALESELAQALSAQGGTAGSLPGGYKQTLDILGAILDTVLTENTLTSGVKSYLQKLQIPLLQAAVADPALLHTETHPAHEVLNLIDHLSIASNEKGEIENKTLRQSLNAITDRIVKDAAENPAVFEEARAQLEKLTAPLLRARAVRIDRVQEACEGAQRIKNARSLVDQEIKGRIGGKTVPAVVPALLDCGWRQLLVLTALRRGPESRAWIQQMGVVDKLLGWLAKERPESPPTLFETHVLIDFVDEHLLTIGTEQMALNRIMDDLTALLVGVGSRKEKRPPEFVSMPAEEMNEEIRPGESAHLKQFRVGDWLKVSLTPGVETPMRLTWMGEDPLRFVFVNQKGGKALELSSEEFTRYLRDHRAVKTESLDLPLMERTTNTLMQAMQDKLKYQAIHDPLTGLINRKEFIRRLERHFALHESQEARHLLCLMEIDQLRIINNLCGMEAGDRLLKEVSAIVTEWLEGDDILARLGDNNFGLLIPNCEREKGQTRMENLLDVLRQYHFTTDQRSFPLGVHMGLVSCGSDRGDVNALLKNADAACLAAKQKGRNLIQFYAEDDVSLEAQKNLMDWAGRIDKVLAENRLFVRCQLIAPIFPERGMEPHHEILLGIRDEQGNIVSPADFVPAAERWKRMSEIDIWQIQSVFRWITQNRERFQQIGAFSINLSGQSLNSDNFLAFLHERLSAANLPAEKIVFEITETAAIDEFSRAEKFIRQIKRYGCKFSLDDFGSGFSSYAYLKNLQVDYLKIDGSFVKDLATSPTDYALVKSMNEIGHSLGMRTIAEYVENDEILDKLKEIGVDYAQGYSIRRPVLLEALA